MSENYPKWIDEAAVSLHKAFSGMIPGDWGPLDFFECWRHLNGTFIDHLYDAVTEIKQRKISTAEIAALFSSPSSFRACIYFTILEYQFSDHTKKQKAREVIDYLMEILDKLFIDDVWCQSKNLVHTEIEVQNRLQGPELQHATLESARIVARLGNAASAMSYVLYRDFYMSESFDVFAPYKVMRPSGERTLAIRTYPKMRPLELWPETRSLRHNSVELTLLYESVDIECEFIGAHTKYTGDVIAGLREFNVRIDGKDIENLDEIKAATQHIGEQVVEYWKLYDAMSLEDLQTKFLEWMGFALKPIFDAADMNWRPTDEMKNVVLGKPTPRRVLVESIPPFEKYVNDPDWEIYWLRELYS